MAGKIIIADATFFVRAFLRDIFEGSGYEVTAEASNGLEAIQLFRLHRPDIMTMDLTMPIMDGMKALKEIRAIDSRAKVIVCSAMGNQSVVMEAMQAGATDFMVKPLHRERLLQSVRQLLHLKKN